MSARLLRILLAGILVMMGGLVGSATADETCQSPFLPKSRDRRTTSTSGTLGIKGVADGTTASSRWTPIPKSASYGKIIPGRPCPAATRPITRASRTTGVPVGGRPRHEPIFIFDVGSNPASPAREEDFHVVKDRRLVGRTPSTRSRAHAHLGPLNAQDGSGARGSPSTAMTASSSHHLDAQEAPYGYDVRVNVNLNRI